MKVYLPFIFCLLAGCSPFEITIEEVTEYAGQTPNKQSAIAAVESFISSNEQVLACPNPSFSAIEVRTTTEFKAVVLGGKSRRTNTIYVDEWGIEEEVYNASTDSYAVRYWSVNGRTGTVTLVGGSGWNGSPEMCSVINSNA